MSKIKTSYGQKALKRAFKESGGDWDLASELFMKEALRARVNGVTLEVFQYYVSREAEFLYEVDEEDAAAA